SIEGVIWVFKALTGVLLMIVLAIFFAYLIAPLVELVRGPFEVRGRERRLPRYAAIGLVYVVIFGSLALTTWLLLPRIGSQLDEFAKQAPAYLTNARTRAEGLNQIYERINLPPAVRKYANDQATKTLDEIGGYIKEEGTTRAIHTLGYLPWLFLVPILAFFFLKDAESFRRSALSVLPQGRLRWRGDEFFQDVNSTLAAYIRAQLIACLLIGTICTIGFVLIGVPYALVLGFAAGVLEFIPLLGPLVVAVIAVSLASFASGSTAFAVLLFLGVLRVVHDYYTYPRIIGSGIHLHPLAVILAILAGHELAGLAGIFLAIPVIAILTVTYRHWLEHKGSQGLVADLLKPAEEAAEQDALAAAGGRALGGDAGASAVESGQTRVAPTAQ
ncbi:MAG TPA: AI-2E family transporter, partial [Pyrinomonadaceae bacterium]